MISNSNNDRYSNCNSDGKNENMPTRRLHGMRRRNRSTSGMMMMLVLCCTSMVILSSPSSSSSMLFVSAFAGLQTSPSSATTKTITKTRTTTRTALGMTVTEGVSEFYQTYPLQSAVLTCGVKASIADGIAQVQAAWSEIQNKQQQQGSDNINNNNEKNNFYNPFALDGMDDDETNVNEEIISPASWKFVSDNVELRRNVAYVLYGGIFVGLMCHLEYNYLFPYLFGPEQQPLLDGETVTTALDLKLVAEKVIFDDFISAPLMWLPPAYFIKALVYDYPLREGLEKYIHDIRHNDLLQRYWTIWVPAQTISFSVVPEHLRVAFMASVSFFWFILFSTLSSSPSSSTTTTTTTTTTSSSPSTTISDSNVATTTDGI